MGKILSDLKNTTAAQYYRHITSALLIITPIYMFSGPFVKAYAADALLEVLKQNGIDPVIIKEMQKQGVENGNSIQNLDKDVDTIKQKVGQVSNQLQDQATQADRVESLVRQLLEAQLRKTEATP